MVIYCARSPCETSLFGLWALCYWLKWFFRWPGLADDLSSSIQQLLFCFSMALNVLSFIEAAICFPQPLTFSFHLFSNHYLSLLPSGTFHSYCTLWVQVRTCQYCCTFALRAHLVRKQCWFLVTFKKWWHYRTNSWSSAWTHLANFIFLSNN